MHSSGPRLIIVALLFSAGYVVGTQSAPAAHADEDAALDESEQEAEATDSLVEQTLLGLDTFAEALGYIEHSYVDDVSPQDLIYGAIDGMIDELDRHSAFFDPDELDSFQSGTDGQYVGVGLELSQRDSGIFVSRVFEGGPAMDAGILADDRIMSVDGEDVSESTTGEIVQLVRGPRGAPVTLGVERDNVDMEFVIVRDTISIDAVSEALLPGGVGWIHVRRFQSGVSTEVRSKLDTLEAEQEGALSGLILDLRGNPGGLLREAISMTDIFVDEGRIVSTNGRTEERGRQWYARRTNTRFAGKLVVLVDAGSASAAEIVAGALQDLQRAELVGATTYGKGSVQSIISLNDGSGLKLTISRYYTPSGRSIHENGIEPDASVDMQSNMRLMPDAEALDTANILSSEDRQLVEALRMIRQ